MVVVALHMTCIVKRMDGDLDSFVYCWKLGLLMWGRRFHDTRLYYL